MQTIKLYRYEREGGGMTVSPVMPDCEYTNLFRLVADEGKALTDGENLTFCVDTDSVDGWHEVDAPDEETDEPIPVEEETE